MMSSGTTLDRLPLPHTRMPKGLFYAAGGPVLGHSMILKGLPQVSKRLMDPTLAPAKKRGGKC